MKKFLIIVFLTFTASFTPIAAKFTIKEISPLSLAFFRFGIATVLLILVALGTKTKFKIDKKDTWQFILLGSLVIPINQFCFLKGIQLSTASHSGVFYACTPLFVFVTSIMIKNEYFSFKKLLTISLSIAGIIIIFWENIFKLQANQSDILIGDILLFFAVLTWSLYLTFSKNMVVKYGALKTSVIAFSTGMVLYIPLFLYDLPNFTLDHLTTAGILGFLHLTFLVAFGGYFVYTYSTKLITTSTLTTLTNTAPVITIIFSWILLNEELSYFFILGAVITIAGIFLTQLLVDKRAVNNKL